MHDLPALYSMPPSQPLEAYAATYERVGWVRAAVRFRAKSMGRPRVEVTDYNPETGEYGKPRPTHQLARLIRRPSPFETWKEFVYADTAWLLMTGNSFWLKVYDGLGYVRELRHLRPWKIRIMPDARTRVAWYEFHLSQGGVLKIPVDQIIHRRLFSTADDLFGSSVIRSIQRDITCDEEAGKFNVSWFKRGGIPTVYFFPKEDLGPTQIKKYKQKIAANYTGSSKYSGWGMLDEPFDVKELGVSHEEMEFMATQKWTREKIATLFEVPPIYVGQWESVAYANADKQAQTYWESVVYPDIECLVELINEVIAPNYDDAAPARLRIDQSSMAALMESTDARTNRVIGLVDRGLLTPNEGREAIGLQPSGDPGMDMYWRPLNFVPLESALALSARGGSGGAPGIGGQAPGASAARAWIDQAHAKALETETDILAGDVRSALEELERRVQRNLEAGRGIESVPDPGAFAEELYEKMRRTIYQMMVRQAHRELERIGRKDLKRLYKADLLTGLEEPIEDPRLYAIFGRNSSLLQAQIGDQLAAKVRNVSEEVIAALRDAISEKLDAGASPPEIFGRIQEIVNSGFRAERITQTETNGVLNAGTMAAFEAGDVDSKQWRNPLVAKEPRPQHILQENAGPIPRDAVFPLTACRWPGDPQGPASEVVFCHCYLEPHYADEEQFRAYAEACRKEVEGGLAKIAPTNGHSRIAQWSRS